MDHFMKWLFTTWGVFLLLLCIFFNVEYGVKAVFVILGIIFTFYGSLRNC